MVSICLCVLFGLPQLLPADTSAASKVHELSSSRYIFRYDIAKAVPIDSDISYADLAANTKTDESQLKRMLRYAMTNHIFHEPRPGFVAHTAPSRLLLDADMHGWNAFLVEDCFSMAASQIDALEKWGHGSQEPTETALNVAFNTDMMMFPFFNSQPDRNARFSKVLQSSMKVESLNTSHVSTGFDWNSLGEEATVVDVGGNMGHCSVVIAQTAPNVKCIVQDLPGVLALAQDPQHSVIPAHLKDRISFQDYNFFDPQPVQADVYFLRMIIHDWSDKYATIIIKQIATAMKPGSRLIIMDQIMQPVGVLPAPVEKLMRAMDLAMGMMFNAKEREMHEWTAIIEAADPRLKVKNVVTPRGSTLSMIEVIIDETGHSDFGIESDKTE